MIGGNLHFDPSKRVIRAEGHIVVDHADSAPGTDAALLELLRKGKTTVRIEQAGTGHWNVYYLTALPEHHEELAAVARQERRDRQRRHSDGLQDQQRQIEVAEKERKRKEREDAGLPPEAAAE